MAAATLLLGFLSGVWISHVAVYGLLPPPTNVTLDCHNLRTVLNWSYDQLSPQTSFRVDLMAIRSVAQQLQVTLLHADISALIDVNDDYFVMVSAIDGSEESEQAPAEGIYFSYYENSPTTQKCFVDLPSVNVTVDTDNNVEMRFPHPWLMYRPPLSPSLKSREKKSHATNPKRLPEFTYSVVVNKEVTHADLSCVESVCEEKFPVEGDQTPHCLRIDGHLNQMAVRATQDYCSQPLLLKSTSGHFLVPFVTAGVAVFAALCLIGFMLYRKSTRGSSALPTSMDIRAQLKQAIMKQPEAPEVFAVPEVVCRSPTECPLVDSEELPLADTPCAECDLRLPISLGNQEEGAAEEAEERGEGAEASGYAQAQGLDDDKPESESNGDVDCSSGYEKRDKVVTAVELAPGDKARGYRG
ncbi:growth/differentiation factor 10b [Genypterus blacodes]|uniref:growth/differentiation factor 10b n=1 Tax=Genypterus blacodes TaxID=154954 RepID=UPI003F76F1BC